MALHRLTSVTMGVPNVAETADYYTEFGLQPDTEGWFTTRDGGRQLQIVHAPTRRLVELRVGVDDRDDLDRAAASLTRLGIEVDRRRDNSISATEAATGTRATLEIAPRLVQDAVAATTYNGPGRYERQGLRAPGLLRTDRIQPRKLGHAVIGSTDVAVTRRFFTDGLGFKLSDEIKDAGASCAARPIITTCSFSPHPSPSCTTRPGRWTTSTTLVAGRSKCSRTTPNATSGGSVDTTQVPTSSGTSRIRPATSASTTPTWIASSMTSCGPPRS